MFQWLVVLDTRMNVMSPLIAISTLRRSSESARYWPACIPRQSRTFFQTRV